jgi:hypothetical protein
MTSDKSMSIMKGRAIWRNARGIQVLRDWGVYAAEAFIRLKALAP